MGTQALDEGEIIVLGEKIQSNKTPKCCLHLGLMPQDNLLCDEFTIEETLDFFGNIYQMDKDILEERKDLLKNLLELPCDSQRIVDCSGGQKRRISLAAAMIHNPKLLILDEPTVGLDPILRVKIWDLLKKSTKDHNMSIIITSHYIEEARNADRCGLMRNGSLLEEDDPENILKKYNCETLEDAFLKLCTNQKEGIQSNIKSKNCQMTNFEFQERKYFHKKTMKALFGKSFVKVKRDPFL
jgi:ABC-type multidrug transport system ATPase subunit